MLNICRYSLPNFSRMPQKICSCFCPYSCCCKSVKPGSVKFYGKILLEPRSKLTWGDLAIVPADPRISRGKDYCSTKPTMRKLNWKKKKIVCPCSYLFKWKIRTIKISQKCQTKKSKFKGHFIVPKRYLGRKELGMLSKKPC